MRRLVLAALAAALVLTAPAQAQDPSEPFTTEGGVAEASTEGSGCGGDAAQRPAAEACVAAWPITRYITYYCQQKNFLGQVLYRYNSRWKWTHGRAGKIHAATHWEWGSHTNLGWRYAGSRYLEPYGAVGTTFVGRSVRGTFNFEPAGTFVRSRGVTLRAGATGLNPYTWGPWCLD